MTNRGADVEVWMGGLELQMRVAMRETLRATLEALPSQVRGTVCSLRAMCTSSCGRWPAPGHQPPPMYSQSTINTYVGFPASSSIP